MCMRFNVIFTRFTHTLNLTCHPAGSNDVTRRGKKIKCPVQELQNAVEMHYNKAKKYTHSKNSRLSEDRDNS
jgi:hypothetical protein